MGRVSEKELSQGGWLLWDIEEEIHEGHLKGGSWLRDLCFGTQLVKLFSFCAVVLVEKDLVICLK